MAPSKARTGTGTCPYNGPSVIRPGRAKSGQPNHSSRMSRRQNNTTKASLRPGAGFQHPPIPSRDSAPQGDQPDDPSRSNQSKQDNDNNDNSQAETDGEGEEDDDDDVDDRFYRTWDRFIGKRVPGKKALVRADSFPPPASAAQPFRAVLAGEANTARSFDDAAEACRKKVAAIVKECRRLNRKYSDPLFDLDDRDSLVSLRGLATGNMPESVCRALGVAAAKRVGDIFESPKFFVDGVDATDIRQGCNGDCWFLAGLMALSGRPELLERLCVSRDETCGVYGFVFYRDGEWISEVVDDKLCVRHDEDRRQFLLNVHGPGDPRSYGWGQMTYEKLPKAFRESSLKGRDNLYFSSCSDSNETWLPLFEKAYAKAHLSYQAIEGGFAGEAIEDLTGGVTTSLITEDILDKNRLWDEFKAVNRDFLFGCGSRRGKDDDDHDDEGFVRGHAYTVLEAKEYKDKRLLKIRNPWGQQEWNGAWSDGSKEWTADAIEKLGHVFGDDGVFYISFDDFLRYYPVVDRTRLFGPEWFTAQRWLSAHVPLSVNYLDTAYLSHKISLTVTKDGPAVIVLAQPDSRYFHGLNGRYSFRLHFRVSKMGEGEDGYIIRSMNSTLSERSCNVEVDLEAGEYEIFVKITPWRQDDVETAADVINRLCYTQREKVLATGRQFDLAYSKGNLRQLERESELKRKQERKDEELARRKILKGFSHESRKRDKAKSHRIRDEVERKKEAKKQKLREQAKQSKADKGGADGDLAEEDSEPYSEVAAEASSKQGERGQAKEETAKKDEEENEQEDEEDDEEDEGGEEGDGNNDNDGADNVPDDVTVSSVADDDWAWDSELDGPIPGEEDDSSDDEEDVEGMPDVDKWDAIAVIGFRVYTQDPDCKIQLEA